MRAKTVLAQPRRSTCGLWVCRWVAQDLSSCAPVGACTIHETKPHGVVHRVTAWPSMEPNTRSLGASHHPTTAGPTCLPVKCRPPNARPLSWGQNAPTASSTRPRSLVRTTVIRRATRRPTWCGTDRCTPKADHTDAPPHISTPVLQSKGLAGSGTKEAVKGNLRRTRNRKSRRPKVGAGAGGEQERRVAAESDRILGPPRPTVREPSSAAQIGSRGQRAQRAGCHRGRCLRSRLPVTQRTCNRTSKRRFGSGARASGRE